MPCGLRRQIKIVTLNKSAIATFAPFFQILTFAFHNDVGLYRGLRIAHGMPTK
jgi:hypothetical protein